MVPRVGVNAEAEIYNYLAVFNNHKCSSELGSMFKEENSNLKIAIVDVWITWMM